MWGCVRVCVRVCTVLESVFAGTARRVLLVGSDDLGEFFAQLMSDMHLGGRGGGL